MMNVDQRTEQDMPRTASFIDAEVYHGCSRICHGLEDVTEAGELTILLTETASDSLSIRKV